MKIAYFDCYSGISGDMVLGALVDIGMDPEMLKTELTKLAIGPFSIQFNKTSRNGISGTGLKVDDAGQDKERTYSDIETIIEESDISAKAKALALDIFRDLAEAEGRVHGKRYDEVHFHEVGAVDSIVDIVGAAVALDALGIERVYSSRVKVGSGIIECRHGKLPAPGPATIELLKGVPISDSGVEEEIVTPTGAAIIRNIAKEFGGIPSMIVEGTGYGAGTKELDLPNLLRVLVGEYCPEDD